VRCPDRGRRRAAAGGNSVGYRGPKRNGIFPATGLMKRWPDGGPKLLWTCDTLKDGWSSAAVADGTVYVGGGAGSGTLFALNLADGKIKWKRPCSREFTVRFKGPRATPTVTDGVVIYAGSLGDLHCFDAVTGRRKWTVNTRKQFDNQIPGWGYNCIPLVVDDKVVMAIRRGKHTLVALNKNTGKLVWATPPSEYAIGNSSATLFEHGKTRLIVHYLWRAILAVEPDTGKVVWTGQAEAGGTLTPVQYGEYFLICRDDGVARAFRLQADGRSFKEIWRSKPKTFDSLGQVVILDGRIYGFGRAEVAYTDSRGRQRTRKTPAWICADLKTGRILQTRPCMDGGSVAAADGMVYFLEGAEHHWKTPRMSLARPTKTGFEPVSTFSPVVGTKELWSGHVIAEGRLFIRHGTKLACYDLRAGKR